MHQNRPIAVVFGGTGFVGHAVVGTLAKEGYEVHIPTRDLEKAKSLKQAGGTGQIRPIYVQNPTDGGLANLMKDAVLVINLIGKLRASKNNDLLSLHVKLATRIARIAKTCGVQHFVHLSAIGANEQSVSSYKKTKAIGEQGILTFFPDAIILKPNVIFGPKDHFFNIIAHAARFLPFLPLVGTGQMKLQPVYVGDVAQAVVSCLKKETICGQVYEINGPQIMRLTDIIRLIMDVSGNKRPLVPVPWWIVRMLSAIPLSPLSVDLVKMSREDHVASDLPQIMDLGITPHNMKDVIKEYLA